MKRLITENASSDAFRPTASIRNTAESEPKSAPNASRLPERKNERLLKRRGKSERHRPKLKFICLCEPDTMPFLNLREDTPLIHYNDDLHPIQKLYLGHQILCQKFQIY